MIRGADLTDFDPADNGPDPVVGEVVALRQFVLRNGVLYGISHRQPILDGLNVAVCRCRRPVANHIAPQPGCTCGFYAYDYPKTWMAPRRLPARESVVTAAVALSGKVLVCQRGLKAQKMRVLAVYVPGPHRRRASALGANYPDVAVVRREAALTTQHPLTALTSTALTSQQRSTFRAWAQWALTLGNITSLVCIVAAVAMVLVNYSRVGSHAFIVVALAMVMTPAALIIVKALGAFAKPWDWDIAAVVEGDGVRPAGVRWTAATGGLTAFARRPAAQAPTLPLRPVIE